MSGSVRVIHIRNMDGNNPDHIYIGRKGAFGRKESPLHNPFRMNDESERDMCCDKFEAYMREKANSNTPQRQELVRIIRLVEEGRHISLVCYCSPKRCHGDSIKKAIDAVVAKRSVK